MLPGDVGMRLSALVEKAWEVFDGAGAFEALVRPSMPVLFFGDIGRYTTSTLRVVTVGLNPSNQEFPGDEPFKRFRGLTNDTARDPARYVNSLARYFGAEPHRRWFGRFRVLLDALDASYETSGPRHRPSAVLHTDICSPLATAPTWSKLEKQQELRHELTALTQAGTALWEDLVRFLRPDIAIFSTRDDHRDSHSLDPLGEWDEFHLVTTNRFAEPRWPHYRVSSRWHTFDGDCCLFVHCDNSSPPLPITVEEKQAVGHKIVRLHRAGP